MKPDKIVNIHSHLARQTDKAERIRDLERHNVVKCCVAALPWPYLPPHRCHSGNDEVWKWMQECPERIVGLGAVDLTQEMDAPDAIGRLRDRGFQGLKFIDPSHPYDHDRYFPLYERAAELGMPILFHTGWLARSASSDLPACAAAI